MSMKCSQKELSVVDVNTDDDLDPAAPSGEGALSEALVESANLGSGEEAPGDEGLEAAPLGAVAVDIVKARQFLKECMTSNPRVKYGLGAKIRSGEIPGRDFKAVDCSGFVREAIRR